eukprot:c43680_g1_i1 orf=3-521(-)
MNKKKGGRGAFNACPSFFRHLLGFVCAASTFFTHGSCQSDVFTPPSPDSSQNSVNEATSAISASAIAGIVISIAVVAIAAVAVFYCLCIVDKRTKNGGITLPSVHVGLGRSPASGVPSLPSEVKDHLRRMQFTYSEVLEITSDLRVKLGEGGFGPVYFGKLKDGLPVAVKRLS